MDFDPIEEMSEKEETPLAKIWKLIELLIHVQQMYEEGKIEIDNADARLKEDQRRIDEYLEKRAEQDRLKTLPAVFHPKVKETHLWEKTTTSFGNEDPYDG